MATYSIFDGGNRRTLPWESIRDSGLDPQYPVMYAAHLKNAHKVIPYHIDFANELFRSWLNLSVPNGTILPNDELRTHVFGPGSVIREVVLQVKGLCPEEGEGGNPPPTPPTVNVQLQRADGTLLSDFGNQTLDEFGAIRLAVNTAQTFTGDGNAYLVVRLVSGELTCVCFGVIVEVVQLYDPHTCECVTPCGAEFPEPNCPPSGLVAAWTAPAPTPPPGGGGGGGGGGGDGGGG